MTRKSVWIGGVLVAMLTLASAVAFADFGSGGVIGNLDTNRDQPPRECICSANYEPVVCRAADGSRHTFSNLCVAGCNGYAASSCTPVVEPVSSR
jgi:hypothetical protein